MLRVHEGEHGNHRPRDATPRTRFPEGVPMACRRQQHHPHGVETVDTAAGGKPTLL
nr:hypothetical protein [uncultured Prevotella sp.]